LQNPWLVLPGDEADFLAPLPVKMLWGVGPKTAARLATIGITKIGELAQQNEIAMLRRFGQSGYDMTLRARGTDSRPLVTRRGSKSISQESTFSTDRRDGENLRQVLRKQAFTIANSLQKKNLTARTIKIKLRWSDFTTLTRQTTLKTPTNDRAEIVRAAEKLFNELWKGKRAVRLLGVGVSGLEKPTHQIGLWDRDWEKERHIRDAVGKLQARFGAEIITRGLKGKTGNEH
jgi:DNA polymerase-4